VILLLCCAVLLAAVPTLQAQQGGSETAGVNFAIAIHGGAGSSVQRLTEEQKEETLHALRRALSTGRDILAGGGSSLDAVEQVIRWMEDNPRFNAGKGAVMNALGQHELDASIMDGRTRSCGAVGGVRTVKNPISLARLVMTQTPHVLLTGEGADDFAREMAVDRVEQSYFWTERAQQRLERAREKKRATEPPKDRGTVGCVALDTHGNLAAGTSTGGLTTKRFGRIGDSPIVGAGTYADNGTCAVSCTGTGEHFIRHAIAYDVSARMAYKRVSLRQAVADVIHHTLKPGDGGLIAVDRHGHIAMDFNTAGMSRGAADSAGRFFLSLEREEQ
jgi:beta-aspartyl-peptidase (threonine type)